MAVKKRERLNERAREVREDIRGEEKDMTIKGCEEKAK